MRIQKIRSAFSGFLVCVWLPLFLLLPLCAGAETLEDNISRQTERNQKSKNFVTLAFENDRFGSEDDRYYTNGFRLTYFNSGADLPEFAEEIDDLIPTFDLNETTGVYYSFGQNIYTPENISLPVPDPLDRPYAAFLYGSIGLTTVTENHLDDIEFTLGMIGPFALGEDIQGFVHEILNARDPKGWRYQLKNEPGFIFSWQRRYPANYVSSFGGIKGSLDPFYGVTLGNVYTYVHGGFLARLDLKDSGWQDVPVRIRPSLPGTGVFLTPDSQFSSYLFAGVDIRAIGRNIFLDGNTFTDSPRVNKKHIVADLNAGISLSFGAKKISYTLVYRTEEFEGQRDPSVFGAINLVYRF